MDIQDDLIGKTVHDSYNIVSRIGEGGMGRVYLAEHARVTERRYAVKVLKRELTQNPKFMNQFFEEARHQAQLSHPNVVQMTDYFKEGEDYFLVLDYVEGHSLAEMIDSSHGPLPQKQALQIFKGILGALNSAHEKAILHRDIKASNVMIDGSGRALLTDFGIARQAGDEQAASLGRVIGTPEYMSPEQFIDSDKIDHRSDVYSAGILLFEMLTGRLPFEGSQDKLKEQHLGVSVPNPRSINPKLKKCLGEIVVKATQKQPDARFQGSLAFLKAIERCERGPRWPLIVLSLSILLATGTWYWMQNEKAIRTLVTLSIDNYALLMQGSRCLKLKETGLDIARKGGDSCNWRCFQKKLMRHHANMNKFFGEYSNALDELSRYRVSTVHEVLKESLQTVDAETQAKRERLRQQTSKNFENLRSTGKGPDQETMLQKCRG